MAGFEVEHVGFTTPEGFRATENSNSEARHPASPAVHVLITIELLVRTYWEKRLRVVDTPQVGVVEPRSDSWQII